MAADFKKEDLRKYAAGMRGEYENSLERIVEIPTVSVEPERKPDVRRGAEYAVSLLEKSGAKAKIFETKGHPIVFGRFQRSANLPTVTVYNQSPSLRGRIDNVWDSDPSQDTNYHGVDIMSAG